MRLILVGPPGAGKGTQAANIVARHGVPHISTGDMFRASIAEGTELGLEAKTYMDRGDLVPDDVVIGMVMERIGRDDCSSGFLLDGFPRTAEQARALDAALSKSGVSLKAVVLLDMPDELVVERITGRRMDPKTGAIYHVKFNPPPPEIAACLVQREDDTEQTCRARLAKYHAETAAVVPHYEAKGLLRRIDGTGSPQEVTQRVLAALNDESP